VLAVDIEKCHQVRVQSIKFNPTTATEQRARIFSNFEREVASGKKIAASHLF
jgi:hypothetical protein